MYSFLPDDWRLDLCVSFVLKMELRQLSLDKVVVAWRLAKFTNKAALNTNNYWYRYPHFILLLEMELI